MQDEEVLTLITAVENPSEAHSRDCVARIAVLRGVHELVWEKTAFGKACVYFERDCGCLRLERVDVEAFDAIWNSVNGPCVIEGDRVAIASILGLLAVMRPEFYHDLQMSH